LPGRRTDRKGAQSAPSDAPATQKPHIRTPVRFAHLEKFFILINGLALDHVDWQVQSRHMQLSVPYPSCRRGRGLFTESDEGTRGASSIPRYPSEYHSMVAWLISR
jgi:hypothetical protein